MIGPPNAINATLYAKLNFDFIRDITPVATISGVPNIMVVHPYPPGASYPIRQRHRRRDFSAVATPADALGPPAA
jgi:hypothetical protein